MRYMRRLTAPVGSVPRGKSGRVPACTHALGWDSSCLARHLCANTHPSATTATRTKPRRRLNCQKTIVVLVPTERTKVSSKYLLPCLCGQQIPIEPRQAGETVACRCGISLQAPTMRKMHPGACSRRAESAAGGSHLGLAARTAAAGGRHPARGSRFGHLALLESAGLPV